MMALGAREAIEERDSSLVGHVEFIGVDGLLGRLECGGDLRRAVGCLLLSDRWWGGY